MRSRANAHIELTEASKSNVAAVRLLALRELWIHTGTACNLECPFCLEGSRPGDARLERITLAELQPYLEQAAQLGAQRFAFTGGEPLIVKDIVKILEYALRLKPCLVLTNGAAPLIKRAHQLQLLARQPHPLSFRVSLDYPDEQQHDAGRGWGNFKRALEGLKLLHRSGFEISIARHRRPDEDSASIEARYRELLRKHALPDALLIVALPEYGRPQTDNRTDNHDAPISAAELDASGRAAALMCAFGRMALKRQGALRMAACPLVDDDERFDCGPALASALAQPTALRHTRCRQCLSSGVRW